MCASNGAFCAPVCTSKIEETRCFSGFLVRHRGLCKKMGINKRSIRKACKTYVSTLVDAGINLETIRKTVGHASSGVTLRNYTLESGKKGGKCIKKRRRSMSTKKFYAHLDRDLIPCICVHQNGAFCAPVCTPKIAETRCFSGFLVRHRGFESRKKSKKVRFYAAFRVREES